MVTKPQARAATVAMPAQDAGRVKLTPEIREACVGDLDEITDLVIRCKLSIEHIEETPFLVACHEGRIVGCIGYVKVEDGWVHIQPFSVDTAFRKRGIGRALLNALVARLLGDETNRLLVALTLFWNNRTYQALGFRQLDARVTKSHDEVGRRKKHAHCTAWGLPIRSSGADHFPWVNL